jgi:tyrosinase
MFAKPSSDPLSHFAMGGIHGLPYEQWEGSGGTQGVGRGGYCTHGSYIFPTWHRPYIALYEVGGILRGVAYTTILIGFYSK